MKTWYYYKNYFNMLFFEGRARAKQWKIEMAKREQTLTQQQSKREKT